MRRIIPIISLMLFFVGATFGQNTVSIADATAPDGSNVLMPVSITALNDVGAVNLNIQFDDAVLTFQSVENNVLTGNFVVNVTGDIIQVAWFSITPVDLSGKMFDLKFAYASGTSALAFVGTNEIADEIGGAYPVTFVDGSIGPQPASMDLSTVFGIPGDTLVVDLDASNLQNIGSMSIFIDYDNTVVEYLGLGDVNLPGFADGITGSTINLGMFNTGGFNHVSGLLAELKFKLISGTEDLVFDQVRSIVEQVDFTVVPMVYEDGRIGEVDPSFVLGDVEGSLGTEVSVPFNGLQLSNIGSFNINIDFDSAVLEFVRIENVIGGALTGNETTPGVLSLGYFNASGLTVTDGKIADIVFNYTSGMTDVDWNAASAIIKDLLFNPVAVSFIDGSVSEASAPILYEFSEAATGGVLEQDWVFNQWAGDAGSNIYVADSTASLWGSHVIVYEDSGFTGLAHVKELALTNYTVSADIYIVGEADPDFNLYTGLGIRMASDEGKYYRLVFRNSTAADNGQIKLQGYDGAAFHGLMNWDADVDFPALATGWHNFKVAVNGNTFMVYLDGTMLPGGPLTDGDPFLELGYAGIFKYNAGFGSVIFDNFLVQSTELPPAQKFVKISDIQQGQNTSGQYTDQALQTTGTVTAVRGGNYFLQDGKGAWNGIYVFQSGHTFVQGDSVTLTGFIMEYFDKTELYPVVVSEMHSSGNTVDPVDISTAAVNDEQYESVLVSVMDAEVTNPDLGFGEWEVDDGSGPTRVDDWLTSWTPAMGEKYDITGVNDYSFDNFKILPRDSSEITLVGIGRDQELMNMDLTAGDLVATTYNNGAVRHPDLSGTGVSWKGNSSSELWRGSLVYGTAAKGFVNGFARNNSTINFDDMENVESYFNAGFDSNGDFDQILDAQIADSNATEPYTGIDVVQTTFANSADGAGVYYQYTFTNNTGAALNDLYAGMFMDWDMNPYLQNSGGVAENEHLVYVYAPGTTEPYYGVAACNGISGGKSKMGNSADTETLRTEGFTYISTIDGTTVTGDQRAWIGSKVPDMANGESAYVIFAVVAGDDLIGIRENAQMAVNHIRALGMSNIPVVGVDDPETMMVPLDFEIAQNYPNPFNPSTTIKYGLPASSQVKITIYNTLGETIDVLVNRDQAAGYYEVNWNASKLASGVYFYSIEATSAEAGKDFAIVKKMMLLK